MSGHTATRSLKMKDIKVRTISKAIQKRLDFTSNAIFFDEPPQNKAARIYKTLCKETNIDMRQEYVFHLKMMNELNLFRNLRLNWDHAFFKNFIMTQVEGNTAEMNPTLYDQL